MTSTSVRGIKTLGINKRYVYKNSHQEWSHSPWIIMMYQENFVTAGIQSQVIHWCLSMNLLQQTGTFQILYEYTKWKSQVSCGRILWNNLRNQILLGIYIVQSKAEWGKKKARKTFFKNSPLGDSQNHRMVWDGRDLKGPCRGQDATH